MKLLVFAHTPPPVHGQSVMVDWLIRGLAGDGQIQIWHVNPRLSHSHKEIGRWRVGKPFVLLAACLRALAVRLRHGPLAFYYVPAPGERLPIYRDWLVMLICRPFFSHLVLHWHASGLREWLVARATPPERWLTQLFLGRADLAIILAPELDPDARALAAKRIAIVPNSVPDSGPLARKPRQPRCRVLYLGLCSRAKGIFDTMEGIVLAHRVHRDAYHLTVAGSFASREEEQEFHARASQLPELISYAGFADEKKKHALWGETDVICFPTAFPHEGQPLVLLEAMAHDIPIITTRWRAIPGMLPPENVQFVAPGRPDQIADALDLISRAPPPNGELREHYLRRFTPEQHLAALRAALLSLG